jgi:hypothetical protein
VERALLPVAFDVALDVAVDFVSALWMPPGRQGREGHDVHACRKGAPTVEEQRFSAAISKPLDGAGAPSSSLRFLQGQGGAFDFVSVKTNEGVPSLRVLCARACPELVEGVGTGNACSAAVDLDVAVDFARVERTLLTAFWKSRQNRNAHSKTIVTMRLDADLLRWFRQHHGYQTRINAILRAYMNAQP